MDGKKNLVAGLFAMAGFMSYGFIFMPIGILMELVLGAPPYFVLVGAISMVTSVFILGLYILTAKSVMKGNA